MLGSRKPSAFLFPHSVDHHTPTYSKDDSGAKTQSFSAATTGINAFVQPAPSKVIEDFAALDQEITHVVFLESQTVFDAIDIDDRLVYDSGNYDVIGKKNAGELDRVFRVDVRREIR